MTLARTGLFARAEELWERRLGTPERARATGHEILFALAALTSVWPLFVARYVPIQDLPQHVAAVRVLHDFHTPAFAFERYFELSLGSTQYLAVYVLAHLLAYVFDVVVATKLVIALALVALPYALRELLAALERPRIYALFCLPLVHSTQFLLGFANFLLGLPLMFWGLALVQRRAALARRDALLGRDAGPALGLGLGRDAGPALGLGLGRDAGPALGLGLALALVATACFFAHIVPFGMLLIGALLFTLSRDVKRSLRVLAPLSLSLVCACLWALSTPAGHAFMQLSSGGGLFTAGEPLRVRFDELSLWLNDILWSDRDERLLFAFALLLAAPVVIRLFSPKRPSSALRRYAPLLPLACLFYFVLPASYGFIWPINARFALLACLFVIPLLPRVAERTERILLLAACWFAFYGSSSVAAAFESCDRDEYQGLAPLLARLPYGSRVAGLIYEPGSRYVRFSPYLHVAAWAQVERGGVAMFTFADFPSSPFRFREDNRPPRVPPRWEWLPSRVDPQRDLAFYDHVLTRGAQRDVSGFRLLDRRGAWALWARP